VPGFWVGPAPSLYGHPDAAIARERIREASRATVPVTVLPTLREAV
jgi:hypothetical protein